MKKRIYLLLETKKRELDSRIYFALLAANKNFSVVLGKKYSIYTKIKYFRKGITIFKSLGPKNLSIMKKFLNNNHKVVAWDEEGLTTTNASIQSIRYDPRCIDLIEKLFLWGVKQKNILSKNIDQFKENLSKCLLTGHPRLDMIQYLSENYYGDRAKEINKKYGKFILITTKFPKANLIPNLVNVPPTKDWDWWREQKNNQEHTLNYYLNFLKNFSERFQNIKIIIRPHPGENWNFWHRISKNYKNILVITDDENTNNWIKASEFVISTNCTTAIESFLLKKKVINYIPYEKEKVNDFDLIFKLTKTVYNENDLFKIIKNWNNGIEFKEDNLDVDRENILKDSIDCYNSYNSVEKILKNFDDIKIENIYPKDFYTNSIFFKYFQIKKRLVNLISNLNFRNKSLKTFIFQKFLS
jgi:surface carbohydrate biosynthesis protein